MRRKHRTNRHSIDYIIKILLIFLLPVVLLDSIISIYVIHSMRSQTVQTLQDTTSLYISQIDTAHISINKYLIRRLTESDDFKTVLETDNKLELLHTFEKVHRDVDTFMESFEEGYQIFIYNKENQRFLRPTAVYQDLTAKEAEELDAALISYMNHHNALPSYSDSWEILKLKSDIYFFKIFHSVDNFVGCFISAKNIVKPLKQVDLGKDGFVALASPEGHLLTQTDKLKTQQLSFPKGDADSDVPLVSVQGSYLIISGALTMGSFHPLIILNKMQAYEQVIVIQFILAGAVLLVAIILFSSMLYMQQKVLRPIKAFLENLSRFDDSTEIMDFKDTQLLELEQANLQFKNLMRQIKKLKIDIYEKELEKQKTFTSYLQLQIRPHFFLNCLNTIYSMAQTQLYEEIMEMSMITSNYFRYIFQNPQDFVLLQEEVKHIEDYMKIQKLRYGDGFDYRIYTEKGTEHVRILPILIQTFIENSVKHAATSDEPIVVKTEIHWSGAAENPHKNIQIQITDTGSGFPEDVLYDLNHAQSLEPVNGHRIGITNAIKRLKLFYEKDTAAITFSNLPQGGACVTILLPANI